MTPKSHLNSEHRCSLSRELAVMGRADPGQPGPGLLLLDREHTFRSSSQDLGEAVRLRWSAVVLAVLSWALLALAGL